MNKPAHPLAPDPAIGPLDEHGQQIWSAEEEAAIMRMNADPEFQAGLAEAEEDIVASRVYTMEQSTARLEERKRQWFADTGRTPPPGYFD